jgi:hypothetical protein
MRLLLFILCIIASVCGIKTVTVQDISVEGFLPALAPTCCPGCSYGRGLLNCCCAPIHTISKTVYRTRFMSSTFGVPLKTAKTTKSTVTTTAQGNHIAAAQVSKRAVKTTNDIAVEHLCPICPKKNVPIFDKLPQYVQTQYRGCCIKTTKTATKTITRTSIIAVVPSTRKSPLERVPKSLLQENPLNPLLEPPRASQSPPT